MTAGDVYFEMVEEASTANVSGAIATAISKTSNDAAITMTEFGNGVMVAAVARS